MTIMGELERMILELQEKHGKPASVFRLDPEKIPELLGSRFGGRPAMLPSESWPMLPDGTPMRFIVQLNLTEAPFVPERLADVKMILVFMEYMDYPDDNPVSDTRGKQKICIFRELNDLVAIDFPNQYVWQYAPILAGHWTECIDVEYWMNDDFSPALEVYESSVAGRELLEINLQQELDIEFLGHHVATKIGGFETQIGYLLPGMVYERDGEENDYEPGVDAEWIMQIASEPPTGIEWGGMFRMLHVSRGTAEGMTDRWYINGEYN
jgi:Domain of unknown function (DUF1963)